MERWKGKIQHVYGWEGELCSEWREILSVMRMMIMGRRVVRGKEEKFWSNMKRMLMGGWFNSTWKRDIQHSGGWMKRIFGEDTEEEEGFFFLKWNFEHQGGSSGLIHGGFWRILAREDVILCNREHHLHSWSSLTSPSLTWKEGLQLEITTCLCLEKFISSVLSLRSTRRLTTGTLASPLPVRSSWSFSHHHNKKHLQCRINHHRTDIFSSRHLHLKILLVFGCIKSP